MNTLYPVFLKAENLHFLVVGGGAVAQEKLHFLLKSSPQARVRLVAPEISDEILLLAQSHSIQLRMKHFSEDDLDGVSIVFAATSIRELNAAVKLQSSAKGLLVNVADTPDLCDFYLGSIITRGPLKIGISTDGYSPTFARKFREWLEHVLPEETDRLLLSLKSYRATLRGNFRQKLDKLNDLCEGLFPHNG